ncbi:hypothetical protein [Nocardiopsis halophila]|uniref:hypothetical protein n=1 Tax=Nocardiopsis halophila TaxID=141692 RepID=UPI00187D8135|nr:hypothetical protein [Nocardiopsis halophila]
MKTAPAPLFALAHLEGGRPLAVDLGDEVGDGARRFGAERADEFVRLYEEAYADLYEGLVQSGTAADLLDSEVARAQAAGDEEAASAQEALAEQIASIPAGSA